MTDPEEFFSEDEEIAELEAQFSDDAERSIPFEAEPADAVEQRLELPDDGADDYR